VIAEAGHAGVLRLVAAEQPAVAGAVAVVLAAERARVAAGLGRAPAPGGAAVPRREAGDASVLRGIAQLLHRARAVAVGEALDTRARVGLARAGVAAAVSRRAAGDAPVPAGLAHLAE